jgi:hypothetical protein
MVDTKDETLSLEAEDWNRLIAEEFWSGTDGSDWTATKYFTVDSELGDIFLNPKAVVTLIDFYHDKAAKQAKVEKSQLPKAHLLTTSSLSEKSTSSEGYFKTIFSDESREKYKGTSQVFIVEEGGDVPNHNQSSHARVIFVSYKIDKSMTVVVLDSAPHWNESLYPELDFQDNDKIYFNTIPLQNTNTGCKTFALKAYKNYLDELVLGNDFVSIIESQNGRHLEISILPESFGRMTQIKKDFLNQQRLVKDSSLKTSTDHTYRKTTRKYCKMGSNTLIQLFTLKFIYRLKEIELAKKSKLEVEPQLTSSLRKGPKSNPGILRLNNWGAVKRK